MFVISAKLSKRRLTLIFIALGAVLILAILLAGACRAGSAIPGYSKVRTRADRISFLRSFGWEVDGSSEQADSVLIPQYFDSVYESYNELQISQGLDLRYIVGREVQRYSYELMNHPSGEPHVRATLLVYKDKVVGGDISSPALDGFIHGFAIP